LPVTATRRNRIGIVGGVGPYAGLDLMKKVFDHTLAGRDQDHVDALLFSLPSEIVDRTEYLEGREEQNPAQAIYRVLSQLEEAGATVAGIPCNTAHAAPIFDLILEKLAAGGHQITLLHMIRETVAYIQTSFPDLSKLGILSTTGTYRSRIYQDALESASYEVITPSEEMQEKSIHPAIYDPHYGIKSRSNPVHPRALANLELGLNFLEQEGAQAVILGCTEISMAFQVPAGRHILAIDPSLVLARALIRHAFPHKLKPL
jgi:aspartate racemase